ncbi:hypothetical protein OHA77_15205 [Streptosporangium sp. NBC_01639]|uniref:hypothetical protein n=1 Tax=Streptosporangium sp. NBC_01639 TaxID=2975948 RepID=UPI003868DBF1|nr:hypothetical protein OHA77_15205 [Streptosporangium sp. NBC_01639]
MIALTFTADVIITWANFSIFPVAISNPSLSLGAAGAGSGPGVAGSGKSEGAFRIGCVQGLVGQGGLCGHPSGALGGGFGVPGLLGVPLGEELGVPLGVPLGEELGVPLGVPLGEELGVPLGVPLGEELGVPLGEELGVPESLGDGLVGSGNVSEYVGFGKSSSDT